MEGKRPQLAVFWMLFLSLPAGAAQAKAPIVFAHGLGVPAWVYESVAPIKKAFRESGYEAHVAKTPTAGRLEDRTRILVQEIRRLVPKGPFHLVAHSMGGLDARLAIRRYQLGGRCLSLTTLATPHRGSPLADWAVARLDSGRSGPDVREILRFFGDDVEAVRELTTYRMEKLFNPHVTDDPRVRYASMGFYIPSPVTTHSLVPWLWWTHRLIADAGYPDNDGEVSLESSRWGEDLGSLPGDHYSETAPVPFSGSLIYRDVFNRVAADLNKAF
jgi:triacylglycerol lipase